MDAFQPKCYDDFEKANVDVLKPFLSARGLKVTGKKGELTSRAFCAWEEGYPITPDEETKEKTREADYKAILKSAGIQKDPITLKYDKNIDMNKLQSFNNGKIICYIIENREFNMDYVGRYKLEKAFSYVKSDFVGSIRIAEIDKTLVITADITPSQKVNDEPRRAWAAISSSDCNIKAAWCSCPAGLSRTCSHVVGMLYKLAKGSETQKNSASCTDVLCKWNVPSVSKITPKKISEINVRHDNLTRDNTKSKQPLKNQTNNDPRNIIHRNDQGVRCFNIYLYNITFNYY